MDRIGKERKKEKTTNYKPFLFLSFFFQSQRKRRMQELQKWFLRVTAKTEMACIVESCGETRSAEMV